MEIKKYKKCRFTAILDNGSMKSVLVKVRYESPDDYIWKLAIEECKNFESPLQQLSWNETAIASVEEI